MFNRIFAELAGQAGEPDRIMIDATHLKAHRTAESLLKGGSSPFSGKQAPGLFPDPRIIGRTKGGLNSKLHAVCDGEGRPIVMMLTEGQMSDHKGAVLLFDAFNRPNAPSAAIAVKRLEKLVQRHLA